MTCPTCAQRFSASGDLLTCREEVKYWRAEHASVAKERDRYRLALLRISEYPLYGVPVGGDFDMVTLADAALKGETQ